MNRRQHGVVSLLLILLAFALGVVEIFQSSVTCSIIYLAVSLLSVVLIVYSFCTKCPCRLDSCGHILPGRLAGMLPTRPQGPYRLADMIGVAVPFLFIIVFPQFWLWGSRVLVFLFWLFIVISLIEIRFYVCKGCGNQRCPLHQQP